MQLNDLGPSGSALQQFTTDTAISEWYANRHHQNLQHEYDKSQNYIRFKKYMAPSQPFTSLSGLAAMTKNLPHPFVVKFDTSFVGIQTVVVESASDFKHVHYAANFTGCSQGIVQDFIQGTEYTVTVLVGKHNWVLLGSACDYKKQFENNLGLNTFGLGSVAPANCVHSDTDKIVDDVVNLLRNELDYRGVLSCQFIVDSNNKLWLLEHNARLCDPEFQSMAELVCPATALTQCYREEYIDQPAIQDKNAVTISLIHQEWPEPQPAFVDIDLSHTRFKIWKNHGTWSRNLYWGSITNSGADSHTELADEVYAWLNACTVVPYRYRKDIGQ